MMKDKFYEAKDMKEKRYVLIRVDARDIKEPKFFDTYDEAHKEMKKQYETVSEGGIGELNDDNAWCNVNGYKIDWKICEVVLCCY